MHVEEFFLSFPKCCVDELTQQNARFIKKHVN